MLTLRRRVGESILVEGPCVIHVTKMSPSFVILAIDAERDVRIMRTEIDRDGKYVEPEAASTTSAAATAPATKGGNSR